MIFVGCTMHKRKKTPVKKQTPPWTIALVATCTILTSFGQYFIKQGADRISSILSIINLPLFIGLSLYGVGAILLIIALKYGHLSVLYPVIALGFIWVALLGTFLLQETLHTPNWIGIGAIVIGVACIGIGGNNG